MKSLLLLTFVLLLTAAGCRTPQRSLTWTGTAAPPPPEAERPRAPTAEPARPEAALAFIDRTPRGTGFDAPYPLTGEHKPEGLELRFRRSVPPETPDFVPRTHEGLDLFIADPAEGGAWLAFYKGACGSLGDVCRYEAALLDEEGARWRLDLNAFLENDRYVEIQDIRYEAGALYFNEACATYSNEAGGRCSSLVRVDPVWQEVVWRTPPLISNNMFLLHEGLVVAGYGFTAEPDALYLVDQRTGRIRARADLDTAPSYYEIQDDRLYVLTYDSLYTFRL